MDAKDDRPWVEKYRPAGLADVVGHDKVLKSLKTYVKEGQFPHLLFAGPAGTGKTSAAYAFANDLMGGKVRQDCLLELNASDANSIDDMREIVKVFAMQQSVVASKFKIIVLDEADNISHDAQSALRRIMETGNFRARFIILCNYPNRIIPPILSRCAVFRFPRLAEEQVVLKLKHIIDNEEVALPKEVFSQIYALTRGDMRQAVTLLQVVAAYQEEGLLVGDPLYELAGYLPPSFTDNLATLLTRGGFSHAKEMFLAATGGKSSRNVLNQLLFFLKALNLDIVSLAKLIDQIGQCDYHITEGASEAVQYAGLVAHLSDRLRRS